MRILISSHRYAPDVGGIETVSALMAEQWRLAGHDVQIVTATVLPKGTSEMERGVWRRPSRSELLALVDACDIFWHSNISLQTAWPLLFFPCPWFITSNTWLHGVDGKIGWRGRLKRALLSLGDNIYPSRPLADHVGVRGSFIRNPYDSRVFRRIDGVAREAELIFVGRLVSDKGVDVLLHALHRLRNRMKPRLMIVGGGPEEAELRRLSNDLGLADQVHFAGYVQGPELALALNQHRVLVVPSRWVEPFGLVALLGVACGCFVIASDTGGLAEAVGPGGTLFPNGDVDRLAEAIEGRLGCGVRGGAPIDAAVSHHLAQFDAARVAARYLEVFLCVRGERIL